MTPSSWLSALDPGPLTLLPWFWLGNPSLYFLEAAITEYGYQIQTVTRP